MPARATMTAKQSAAVTLDLTTNPDYGDFKTFCRRHWKVLNRPETSGKGRSAQLVALEPNPIQLDLIHRIERAMNAGKPPRFLVLKARRMGISTIIEAYYAWRMLRHRNTNVFIAAQDDKSTANVFNMAKTMFDHLPAHMRPERRHDNVEQLWFSHRDEPEAGLDCRYEVVTAKSSNAARSYEVHLFHGSEQAFWDDPETFMLGLSQCLSDDPTTCVVLESTANGAGGYFYNEFWAAYRGQDRHGLPIESDWEAVFYGWHRMPHYRRALPPGMTAAQFLRTCDDVLIGMVQEYGLTPEQACWAKYTWANKCQRSWEYFRQEYPGKPEEAFSYASSRVFYEPDLQVIEAAHVRAPIWRGMIVDGARQADADAVNHYESMQPLLNREQGGHLWIWDSPEDGLDYLVVIDPAAGRTTGDDTAIQVLRQDNLAQVAEYTGTLDLMRSAEAGVLLAILYGGALLSWEVTGIGHGTTAGVLMTGYPRLFERTNLEASDGTTDRVGWSTNRGTKPLMISLGVSMISRKVAIIRSERLLNQLRSFREFATRGGIKGGVDPSEDRSNRLRWGAPPGELDDCAMAWLQGVAVLQVESIATDEPNMFTRQADRDETLEDEYARVEAELDADAPSRAYIGTNWS